MVDLEWVSDLLGGATAGLVGKFFFHPIDTAKSRIQATGGSTQYRGTLNTISMTYRESGMRGLYRGIGAVLAGGVPAVCIYLTSYEYFKKTISGNGPSGQKILNSLLI